MKFEDTIVSGLRNAIFGIRLPLCKDLSEVKEKSDSHFNLNYDNEAVLGIGEKDMELCKKLIHADQSGGGQPNSKFLRMIHAQVVITGPLYWWKEMDTYKVGTTANSTSTMHKLASTPITLDCFEMDDFEEVDIFKKINYLQDEWVTSKDFWGKLIPYLEQLRTEYNETKDRRYWKELIRLLPESWLQTRMFDCDYATLRNIYKWRKGHKLTEWHKFCEWIESLPYAKELICE